MKLLGFIFIISLSFSALADGHKKPGKKVRGLRGVCKEEIARHCSEEKGGRKVFQCLAEHTIELSDACKERVEKRKNAKRVCKEDRQKYCSGMKGSALRNCLDSNFNNFSKQCQEKISRMKKRLEKRRERRKERAAMKGLEN